MAGMEIGFDKPGYLLLLALLPLLWMFSFRSLAGLGRIRRIMALLLRTLVLTGIVLALAGVQLLRTSDRVTVVYLLDQSESIPTEKRQAMLDYVVREVAAHRDAQRADRAGVIVFGRNASIEVPPFDDDILLLGGLESYVDLRTDATDLSAALKLAQASFPEDSSKRVVIVTDGNENLGDAQSVAATLAESGVGIDVAPVRLTTRSEVAIERIKLPTDIRRGQAVDSHVILNNFSDQPISGRLRLSRRIGPQEEFLGEEPVELPPGKKVLTFTQQIDQPAVYTYQADFIPDDPADDLMTQNNRATAFTHVQGKGRVLFVENWERVGEFDGLVEALRNNNLEITRMSSDQLYTSLAELQGYDTVVLADVPRSSGDDAQSVSSFSDEQVEMLVRNTEQMGAGIVMIGGPNSFGVGGWSNTELEKAMPVDFQIKNAKIRAVGAVVLMMHASELADGNYWQKKVAEKAISALGPMDYCGLVHWDFGGDRWLWNHPNGLIQVGSRRNMMLARLGRMQPGDMPEFDPAMKMALAQFNRVNASVKLMLIISDGDPSEPSLGTMLRYKQAQVQISTVAVGTHGPAGHQTLQNIANFTGGRYYVVKDPRALPKIYVSEVRRVARPLIFEPDSPLQPEIVYPHEIVQGINGPLPPLSGFVLTSVKENPLVEVAVRSPLPADPQNSTILAAWTYGLGRTAVLTTDAGQRWASAWKEWENYDKLFTQLVRWSMRPVNDTGKFTVATDVKDGKVRVVVTALDKDDAFLNFLNMTAVSIDPQLQASDVNMQQVAAGRYVGEFDADQDGNYFLTINPGPGQSPILTGVNVPYSAEYRAHETNMALLNALVRLKPTGGESGQIIQGELDPDSIESLLHVNTFRRGLPPAVSSQDVWPLILLGAACIFFADIFVRRVTIGIDWLRAGWTWLVRHVRRQQDDAVHEERLERLRTSKAAITGAIDERRAATRFEPEVAAAQDDAEVVTDTSTQAPEARQRSGPQLVPEPAEESYTSRLLKAKKQAWKDEQP